MYVEDSWRIRFHLGSNAPTHKSATQTRPSSPEHDLDDMKVIILPESTASIDESADLTFQNV